MTNLHATVLVLVGMTIGACAEQLAPTFFAHAAPAHRCDYTYITDSGTPEIGQTGEVTYDDEWQKVLSEGWTLKATTGVIYVFERCQ